MMKTKFIFPLLILITWLGLIVAFQWSLIEWINITFLVGLLSLLAFTLVKITETGFFQLFTSGFKKINITLIPKSRSHQRIDDQLNNDPNLQQFKKNYLNFLNNITFKLSITTMLLSLIGLIIFYQ
ncbi:DUF3899 domain-containing protein [Cytobacillus depressus]|uniref:DUF3899 domain-containing protein n=1 Tax=Cytobacillus depressus TaxID=1602942 RepID=A0A6L3V8A1_9BACI|nr:DUF3899 domain-containing protein [Cytobacillus depressus]KAB2336661.1 DUF3899 domain-containing protein [Cytobacillus depressus]